MTISRDKHPTKQRILNELQQNPMLSKYDIEARCFISMRNANNYLKLLHENKQIHIAGYRRDSPHGSPTTMWAYGEGEDARKPRKLSQAKKSRKYRAENPEAVIRDIMRKRAKRYEEKHHAGSIQEVFA